MIYLRNRFTGEVIHTYVTEAARDAELKLAVESIRGGWKQILGPQTQGLPNDLRLVDFAGDDLKGFDLRGLDLSCADLSRANLEGANLADSCLAGARIQSANLTGANLAGAQLSGADFTGSILDHVNIARAELTDVNFKDATLDGVKLASANLSRIKEDFLVSIDLGPRGCVAFLRELQENTRTPPNGTKSRSITAKFFGISVANMADEDLPCKIAIPWMREYMQEKFMMPSVPIDEIAEVVAALRS